MIYENSGFPPKSISSTKHAKIPITICSFVKTNIPLSNNGGMPPNLIISSFSFRYQNLLTSARPYTHFCRSHTLSALASFGGQTKAVRSIVLPCKNVVLTSNKFSVYLFDAITE